MFVIYLCTCELRSIIGTFILKAWVDMSGAAELPFRHAFSFRTWYGFISASDTHQCNMIKCWIIFPWLVESNICWEIFFDGNICWEINRHEINIFQRYCNIFLTILWDMFLNCWILNSMTKSKFFCIYYISWHHDV